MITASKLYKSLVLGLSNLYDKNEAASLARIVFQEKLGISKMDIALEPNKEINKAGEDKIARASKRLLEGTPIQYILGYADFCGMRLKVNKHTLIPRPETEELVQLIVDKYKRRIRLSILDIGTGSGCIAIALKKGLRDDARVDAIDISYEALQVAKANALIQNAKVKFIRHDIFNNNYWERRYRYDIIVSNPPYVTEKEKGAMHVNVLNYEPYTALFVPDNDPLKFYKRIAEVAYDNLWRNGRLFLEVNPEYCLPTKEIFSWRNFKEKKVYKDFSGKDRFISCQVNFPPSPKPLNFMIFDSFGNGF